MSFVGQISQLPTAAKTGDPVACDGCTVSFIKITGRMLPGRRGYRELNIGSVAGAQSVHLAAADTNTECRPVETRELGVETRGGVRVRGTGVGGQGQLRGHLCLLTWTPISVSG